MCAIVAFFPEFLSRWVSHNGTIVCLTNCFCYWARRTAKRESRFRHFVDSFWEKYILHHPLSRDFLSRLRKVHKTDIFSCPLLYSSKHRYLVYYIEMYGWKNIRYKYAIIGFLFKCRGGLHVTFSSRCCVAIWRTFRGNSTAKYGMPPQKNIVRTTM